MLPSGASEAQEAVLTHIKSPSLPISPLWPAPSPRSQSSENRGRPSSRCHCPTCRMVNLPGYLREHILNNRKVEGGASLSGPKVSPESSRGEILPVMKFASGNGEGTAETVTGRSWRGPLPTPVQPSSSGRQTRGSSRTPPDATETICRLSFCSSIPPDGLLMNPFEFPVQNGKTSVEVPPISKPDNSALLPTSSEPHWQTATSPPAGPEKEGVLPHKGLRMAQAPGALHELDPECHPTPLRSAQYS